MEEIEELDFEIRPAEIEDFDTLSDISRVCFPEELRWRARKSHNRKWWSSLVNSENCQVWVCCIYGEIVSFIILAISREAYEDAVNTQHYSLIDALRIFIHDPKAFFNKVSSRIKRRKMNKILSDNTVSEDTQLKTYKRIRDKIRECVPWCGPVAVVPGIRGKGISRKMMEQCFEGAKTLGYTEIYTAVQKRNMMSRIMVAIVGFEVVEEIDYLIFYKKTL